MSVGAWIRTMNLTTYNEAAKLRDYTFRERFSGELSADGVENCVRRAHLIVFVHVTVSVREHMA